jgi:glucokinase
LGIAGPIINQRCQATNLPWSIAAENLQAKFATPQVKLLNDLEAAAYGMLHLADDDLVELNPHARQRIGNKAVIAAGTGLGEAILYWDGQQHRPIATEGGHCDFAAQNDRQDQLLKFLRRRYHDHVSSERIISGIGFSHLYDFLCEISYAPACTEVPDPATTETLNDERNAIISSLGLAGKDPLCQEALRMFVQLYGAEAGNLVLKSFATGGLFIGGGIAPKIRSAMEDGLFLKAFTAKGRYQKILETTSVKLALNPRTALIGAAHFFN